MKILPYVAGNVNLYGNSIITNAFNYFSFSFNSKANLLFGIQTRFGFNKSKMARIVSMDFGGISSKTLIRQTRKSFETLSEHINNFCDFNDTLEESYMLLLGISSNYLNIISRQAPFFP